MKLVIISKAKFLSNLLEYSLTPLAIFDIMNNQSTFRMFANAAKTRRMMTFVNVRHVISLTNSHVIPRSLPHILLFLALIR